MPEVLSNSGEVMRVTNGGWVLRAVTLLGLAPGVAGAQARLVRGVVRDSVGGPVVQATIAPLGARGAAAAGPNGRFALFVGTGVTHVVATHIGFRPETLAVVGGDDLVFRLVPAPLTIDPITVAAERSFTAAGSSVVRRLDVMTRPRDSSQELLRLVPGLVVAQHAGGGKAEQIFLRGFDADHGTDVAITVDGTPVNQVSHAHGHGYADLHFLIPEVVAGVEVRKGPYDAADGDFATAGAVSFETLDRLPGRAPWVEARGGSFRTGHTTLLAPFGGGAGEAGGYVAAAAHHSDGPFEAPQDHRRYNLFAKTTAPVGAGTELVATASGFGADWAASGQVPDRAVRSGLITRFGAIDDGEGGSTSRQEVSLGVRSTAGPAEWQARAFVARYTLTLYSNFTFYLNDSVNGDGIAQRDDRVFAGARATYARLTALHGRPARWDAGAGFRHDAANVELFPQARRQRLGSRVDARIGQTHAYGWFRQRVDLTARLRVEVALRGDVFRFAVTDRLQGPSASAPGGSGTRGRGILSPKVNLAYAVGSGTSLFANAAGGFHTNDARDVVPAPAGSRVLPRAKAAELGARHTWGAGSVALSAWLLDLESELIYVGDEGVIEPSGRTRRVGADLEGRLRLTSWLWADADVNLSRGRLRDAPPGANRVPLAPTLTSTGGLTVRDQGPVAGGLRYRAVGSRAGDEANTVQARGYTLVEAFASWRVGGVEVQAVVDNLFNVEWNEAQVATTSRLPGEPAGITELHYTPGARRALQLAIRYAF